MKKVINFINKSINQIHISYLNLKTRWKNVEFHYYYYNGWWQGWFVCEGKSKLKLT
jgi:hypothetical protein